MKNSNNHNSDSTCAYSETLVAVLYHEASAQETAEFGKHLEQCALCGEELVAFGTLKIAVSDWRETEFAPLASPNIALPRVNEINVLNGVEKTSFFDKLRSFFSPVHFGWQTALVLPALGIFALLVFALTQNWRTAPEKLTAQVPPVPTFSATPPNVVQPKVENPAPKIDLAENKEPSTAANQREEKSDAATVRAGNKTVKQTTRAIIENSPKPQNAIHKQSQPVEDLSILPAEADDNSPRLTDLLDEIEPSV